MPAYLQPLAFVSSGVIQPDLEDEPAENNTAAGLGFQQPECGEAPATTTTAAGLGSPQPVTAGLGFEAVLTGGAAGDARIEGEAAAEAAAGSAAEIPDHPGLGFAPSSMAEPPYSAGFEPDPPEPDAAPAGLGYDSTAAAGSPGGSDHVAGLRHQDAAAQPSAVGSRREGPSGQGAWARNEATAGRGTPAGDAAAVTEQLAGSLAAWAERHVDAAGAAEFERIAGMPLHTVLLRGLAR